MQLKEIVHFDFDIVVVDGLRVAGAGGDLEIAATVEPNLMVIRDPVSGEPYLPGSSLKGKLRSLTESVYGRYVMKENKDKLLERVKLSDGKPCRCGQTECGICTLFGAHLNTDSKCGPTRMRVTDAHLSELYRPDYNKLREETGIDVEHKAEVIIDRNTNTGSNPRTGERVPPGARFAARITLRLYDVDENRKTKYQGTIEQALGLLEEADSLGGGGSRGYGRVKLENRCIHRLPVSEISAKFNEC